MLFCLFCCQTFNSITQTCSCDAKVGRYTASDVAVVARDTKPNQSGLKNFSSQFNGIVPYLLYFLIDSLRLADPSGTPSDDALAPRPIFYEFHYFTIYRFGKFVWHRYETNSDKVVCVWCAATTSLSNSRH